MDAFWCGFDKQAALRAESKLEPQQERVKRRLEKKPGLLVYHGLGSGKTLSSLAATQGMKTDVVVPASLRGNYAKEVSKHTTGFKPNIMSYEKATKGVPSPGEALVIDEAHALADSSSKRTQALLKAAPGYKKRILLTGTPIKNYPAEIAPLLRAVRGDSAVPLDPKTFNERFVEEVHHNPSLMARLLHRAKPGVSYRIKNIPEFTDLVRGYVDYHAPSQKNFPSVSHEVVETPMDAEQQQYYRFVLGKAGPALAWKIKHGMPPSKQEAKSLNSFLSGARQVSNSTAAFGGQGLSPKIHTAVRRLQERERADKNFKGLVYSNFLDSGVRNYAKQLEKAHIPHAVFSGELNDAKRKQIVDDYNSGKIKVLLVSGAGAQGLDLKGTKLVQLLEPAWNETRMAQATGRAVRYKSHEHLPENERHVHIERYHSTLPQGLVGRALNRKNEMSTDQYMDMLSKQKEELNDQFLNVLRQVGQQE